MPSPRAGFSYARFSMMVSTTNLSSRSTGLRFSALKRVHVSSPLLWLPTYGSVAWSPIENYSVIERLADIYDLT